MNVPGLDGHQRRLVETCTPENHRFRAAWRKDIEDYLRPIARPLDSDVLAAIKFASARLWRRAA
jgi:hypothetical protein